MAHSYFAAARDLSWRIGRAIGDTLRDRDEGMFRHEPSFTDRMLGRISAVSNFGSNDIKWFGVTLTSSGRNSQESKFGADFMVVLNVALPGLHLVKGFLAQAKIVRGRQSRSGRTLVKQCQKMLDVTAAAFVFLYLDDDVRVVPAIAVIAAGGDLKQLESRPAQRLFEDHLECFVGDGNLAGPGALDVSLLEPTMSIRKVLLFRAAPARPEILVEGN